MHHLPRFHNILFITSTQKHLRCIHALKDKSRLIKWTNFSLTQIRTFLPWLTTLFQHKRNRLLKKNDLYFKVQVWKVKYFPMVNSLGRVKVPSLASLKKKEIRTLRNLYRKVSEIFLSKDTYSQTAIRLLLYLILSHFTTFLKTCVYYWTYV